MAGRSGSAQLTRHDHVDTRMATDGSQLEPPIPGNRLMRLIVVDDSDVLVGELKPIVRKSGRARIRRLAAWIAIIGLTCLIWTWWRHRAPVRETQIYEGIAYGCDDLPADQEGRGLVHWVKVDLSAPGIELYVTPLDSEALAHGWQYRLRTTSDVVESEQLAVGVNATYHGSDSGWLPLPGDYARSKEALIHDYRLSHVPQHTYLLWFDKNLVPAIETARPPSEDVLRQARWALGGRGAVLLHHGEVFSGTPFGPVDAHTAVGVNREQHRLILAAFQHVSPRRALEKLIDLGAEDGMLLDGGSSTSMALGNQARLVRPGTLIGGWRPVATHFGIRAHSLPGR